MLWEIAAYLLLELVVGGAVAMLVAGRGSRARAEFCGHALCLGAATLGIAISWLGLAYFPIDGRLMRAGSFGAILLFALAWVGRRRRAAPAPTVEAPTQGSKVVMLLVGILLAILATACIRHAIVFGLHEWDAYSIWALKAKLLLGEAGQQTYWSYGPLAFSHQDYPLLVPGRLAAASVFAGGMDAPALGVISLAPIVGFVVLLGTEVRRRSGWLAAALVVGMAASTPMLLRWSGAATADVTLTAFLGGMLLCTVRWLEHRRRSDLALAALYTVAVAYTKNEGLVLAGVHWGLLLVAQRKSPHLYAGLVAASLAATLLAPWLVFVSDVPKLHEDYASQLTLDNLQQNAGRLPPLVGATLHQVVRLDRWGLLWIVTALLSLLRWRQFVHRAPRHLALFLLAHLCLYALVLWITPWALPELLDGTFERLILHTTPAAFLVVTLCLERPSEPAP